MKHLKSSIRHLLHNKLYACINVSGLAIGVTCVLLAVLFVKDERSFDKFHEKGDNLYRVLTNVTGNKGERKIASSRGSGTFELTYTTRKVVATVVNSDSVDQVVERMKKAMAGEKAVIMISLVEDLVLI